MYAEDIERYDALMELLTEIRDRLPAPQPEAQHQEPHAILFGYAMGSGEVPTADQMDLARSFIDGSMFRDSPSPPVYPVIAREVAWEIVHIGEVHGL
jgi:hypothetical protein